MTAPFTGIRRIRSTLGIAAGLALLLAAPATAAEKASATFVDRDGKEVAVANLTETPHGVLFEFGADGLPQGTHAFHVHETGDCGDDFKAAGGHYAPDGHEHGFKVEDGYHAGDLPNIYVHADGMASAELFSTRLTLADGEGRAPIFDDDGSAIVIHQEPDDYESQPSGSGGDRIACAVIEATE